MSNVGQSLVFCWAETLYQSLPHCSVSHERCVNSLILHFGADFLEMAEEGMTGECLSLSRLHHDDEDFHDTNVHWTPAVPGTLAGALLDVDAGRFS